MNAFTETEAKPVAKAAMTPVKLNLPNDRWKAMEIIFWLLPVAAYFPSRATWC
jgi:branched-chain amino acid transport system permease protein